ncbi:hypothetical protein KSP39_PZI008756 [Platanthera zijinensis]|uniref:Uncharacterized protein n=1 Tax=Platanthera zijinensis TaxID=2320716 RepID=A0AAP0BKS9_9ASPA
MALLNRVSEGQLNERLMNAAGSDEPITRTRSSTRRAVSEVQDDDGQKHDRGLRGPRSDFSLYISHSYVSMRLFGSTGEPDGRGEGIWDGGLVISL